MASDFVIFKYDYKEPYIKSTGKKRYEDEWQAYTNNDGQDDILGIILRPQADGAEYTLKVLNKGSTYDIFMRS